MNISASVQYFAKTKEIAAMCGVSVPLIHGLVKDGTLKEHVHFRRFREDTGNVMFYVPMVVETLKPAGAPVFLQVQR